MATATINNNNNNKNNNKYSNNKSLSSFFVFSVCFSPQLYAKYPNRPMILEVNNTEPITVNCTSAVVTGLIPGTIKVLVEQADNSTVEAFTLGAVSQE